MKCTGDTLGHIIGPPYVTPGGRRAPSRPVRQGVVHPYQPPPMCVCVVKTEPLKEISSTGLSNDMSEMLGTVCKVFLARCASFKVG